MSTVVIYSSAEEGSRHGQTYAYLRTSTDKQDLNHQKLEILAFAQRHALKVDEFVEIAMSAQKTTKQRRIDELTAKIQLDDILVVSELSRLAPAYSNWL